MYLLLPHLKAVYHLLRYVCLIQHKVFSFIQIQQQIYKPFHMHIGLSTLIPQNLRLFIVCSLKILLYIRISKSR